MKVAACYKCVPNADTIAVNANRTLNLSGADWEIGQYDLKAVEEARKIALATEGEAIAVTVGGEILSNTKMKKAILSRGMNEMFGVQDEAMATADSFATAKTLKKIIDKVGGVELIICGEGSSDEYNQQVGNILGGLMGWTTINGVSAIELVDGGLKVNRTVEDGTEIVTLALPAVVSVTSDINTPKIPTMKDIMGAGKKPSTVWSAADVDGVQADASETLSILAPEQMDRLKVVIEGDDEESVAAFVEYMRKAL